MDKQQKAIENFNPRSRVGSDATKPTPNPAYKSNFNPRSRVGSDCILGKPVEQHQISILAPAWGATTYNHFFGEWDVISIHAPARGATKHVSTGIPVEQFQSSLPRGERHQREPCNTQQT